MTDTIRERTDHSTEPGRYPALLMQKLYVIGQSEKRINMSKECVKGRHRMRNITQEELDAMEAVDVRTVDISTLTDIRDIRIDTKLPVEKKLALFAEQTDNLFIHRIGDYVVKVRFQKEGPTIDDKMEEYLRHLAQIHI